MMQCVYMKSKSRKEQKKGIIYCRHFSEDKNIKTDCSVCKKYVDRNKLKLK